MTIFLVLAFSASPRLRVRILYCDRKNPGSDTLCYNVERSLNRGFTRGSMRRPISDVTNGRPMMARPKPQGDVT